MSDYFNILPPSEQIPLKMRVIYENFGYKKFSMSKFEPYDLYRDHRNFIKSEGIITFNSPNGDLMALRPDVTTSIVKHVSDKTLNEKLYYLENVFRLDEKSHEFKEIRQMGVEFIGGGSEYSQNEIILLAVKSLETLSDDYRLNINHMGLIEGLLEFSTFAQEDHEFIKGAIKHKNIHDILYFGRKNEISNEKLEIITSFAGISGDYISTLEKISGYLLNDTMITAYNELVQLQEIISEFGLEKKISLDLSVINDIGYYNGLVFRGYIKEASSEVLSGGRYDNMMKRFGKSQSALGFALYLGELDRALHRPLEFDADVMLLQNGFPPKRALKEIEYLNNQGLKVFSCENFDADIKVKKTYKITSCGIEEITKEGETGKC